MKNIEYFPDGTQIDSWFYNYDIPSIDSLGKKYKITDYNILDDGLVYTKELQSLIDLIHENGGGVLYVPEGTYYTGSLYFKQGVNLYIESGGVLKGSDDINDYDVMATRIEGETCKYITALINVDNVDGFTMCGSGTIDGNGLKSWKAFWLRRKWNPQCLNKDEQRPRLVYISNSKNINIARLHLKNSHFWTTHIYKCRYVKYIGCNIFSPRNPIKAPSTDAIDIDACTDVLIKNCYMEVNDDAVALKGGKGPWADTDPFNGPNERIIIEDCEYGFCHSCLTCGSESIHNKNIIVRRIKVSDATNLLWLKMRPDTKQHYEYITVEDITGDVKSFIHVRPWTQFFDLKGREDMPISIANNIVMRNCNCKCSTFFNVAVDNSKFILKDFEFSNINIKAMKIEYDSNSIENLVMKNNTIQKI